MKKEKREINEIIETHKGYLKEFDENIMNYIKGYILEHYPNLEEECRDHLEKLANLTPILDDHKHLDSAKNKVFQTLGYCVGEDLSEDTLGFIKNINKAILKRQNAA